MEEQKQLSEGDVTLSKQSYAIEKVEKEKSMQEGLNDWEQIKRQLDRMHKIDSVSEVPKGYLAEAIKCSTCAVKNHCPQSSPNSKGCTLRYNSYLTYLKMCYNPQKEIIELENAYASIKGDLMVAQLELNKSGEVLSKNYLEMMKLAKDILIAIHKIKYGTKTSVQIDKQVTINDIRTKIFEVEGKIIDKEQEKKEQTINEEVNEVQDIIGRIEEEVDKGNHNGTGQTSNTEEV